MRVLHVNSGNMYGGVETILVTLARMSRLCPELCSEFAVCCEGRLNAELRDAGATVHVLGEVRISRPWTVWKGRRRLKEILRRERFDAVICHMPWSLAVFGNTAIAEQQKLAFWAHGFHTGSGWLERAAKSTRPDLAIANSRFTADGVSNLFSSVPTQVVYAPIGPSLSGDARQIRQSVREQENTPEDAVVILQVSRLESWKGQRAHLEALKHLRSNPRWTCWIAGGPQTEQERKYLDELKAAAVEAGIGDRVRFLGQRSDIPQLLAAADIFCQPNESPEPFGIVFIEALWAERPVITTSIGGAKEIIDSSCGLLVQPGDTSALAKALQTLIESPKVRTGLGVNGPKRARELCEPAVQLKMLKEALESMIHRSGGLQQ